MRLSFKAHEKLAGALALRGATADGNPLDICAEFAVISFGLALALYLSPPVGSVLAATVGVWLGGFAGCLLVSVSVVSSIVLISSLSWLAKSRNLSEEDIERYLLGLSHLAPSAVLSPSPLLLSAYLLASLAFIAPYTVGRGEERPEERIVPLWVAYAFLLSLLLATSSAPVVELI